MAASTRPKTTDGIEFLSEIFFDKDGNEVDDPKKAATGEVTVRYPDGRVATHMIVAGDGGKGDEDEGADEEAAPEPEPGRRVVRRK